MKLKIDFISSKNQLYLSLGLIAILLLLLALSLLPVNFKNPMAKLIYSSSGLDINNKALNSHKTIFSNAYLWPNDTVNSQNSLINLLYLNEAIYLTFDKDSLFTLSKQGKFSHIKIKNGRLRFNNALPCTIIINNQHYHLTSDSQFEIDYRLANSPITKVFKGKIAIQELDIELEAKQIFYNKQKQSYNHALQEPFGFYNIINSDSLRVAIRPYLGSSKKIKAVELTKQSSFRNILYRRNIDELDFFQLDLEPSSYFWRLVYQDGTTSLATPFVILPKLAQPISHLTSNFIFDKDNYLQDLSLNDIGFTTIYKLELAKDATFNNLVASRNSNQPRFSLANLANGYYFYRFKIKNYQQDSEYVSNIGSFTMTDSKIKEALPKKEKILAKPIPEPLPTLDENEEPEEIVLSDEPTNSTEINTSKNPAISKIVPKPNPPAKVELAISPANNAIINLSGKKSIDFNWQTIATASDYSLSIVSNNKTITNKTLIKGNNFTFKQMQLLTVGNYSWKLSAINRTAKPPITLSETTANFTITLDEMPPIIYTGEKKFLLSAGPSQKITWQAISRTNKYAIMVFKKDNHNTRVLNATSSLTTFNLRLVAGQYSLSLAPFNELGQMANNPTIIDIEVK